MKITDFIFAIISGTMVGFLVSDFFGELGIEITFFENIIIWLVLSLLSSLCLWLAYVIGKQLLFVFQAAKHILVGAFVTVIDLKLFELLIWVFALAVTINPLIPKAISFLFSTALKYIGNKYWAFQKLEKEYIKEEVTQFFIVTLVGLFIDVSVFYYATVILGPPFAISSALWIKLSVIIAALAAAIWNFLGYKFLVFKK